MDDRKMKRKERGKGAPCSKSEGISRLPLDGAWGA